MRTVRWWEYRKRSILSGAIAAYQMEIEALDHLGHLGQSEGK